MRFMTVAILALLLASCSTPTPTTVVAPAPSEPSYTYDDLSVVALERVRIPEDWEVGAWEAKCDRWGCYECPLEGCWVGGEGEECHLSFAVWLMVEAGLDQNSNFVVDEEEVGHSGMTCMAYDPTEDGADPVQLLEDTLLLVFSPDVPWLKHQ